MFSGIFLCLIQAATAATEPSGEVRHLVAGIIQGKSACILPLIFLLNYRAQPATETKRKRSRSGTAYCEQRS